MNRSRYEPVSQADTEVIELDRDASYNYNSAIPNSPPPSFHSSQSTPAASVVNFDPEHDRAYNNVTPTPRTAAAATGQNGHNADAVIVNLRRRIERLEETIGSLLLEKPPVSSSEPQSGHGRSNCCVSFPDPASLSLAERAELLRSSSSNCCVRFGGRGGRSGATLAHGDNMDWKEILRIASVLLICFAFLAWIALLVWLNNRSPRVVGCDACFEVKAAPTTWHDRPTLDSGRAVGRP